MSGVRKKLLAVGDEKCGKTLLLVTWVRRTTDVYMIPSVLDKQVTEIVIDDEYYELEVEDTSGWDDDDRLRSLHYPNTDVILLCYSVDRPKSLENISIRWIPEVQKFCPNVPIVLVGNMMDLRDDEEKKAKLEKRGGKIVTFEQGQEMCDKIKAFAYLECSSESVTGIKEVFETAMRAALAPRKIVKTERKCKIL